MEEEAVTIIKPTLPEYKQPEQGDRFTTPDGNLLQCKQVKTLGNKNAIGENKTNKVSIRTIIKEVTWDITFPIKPENDGYEAERTITTTKKELVILKSDFTEGKLKTKLHFKTKDEKVIQEIINEMEEDNRGIVNKVLMKTNIDPIQSIIKGGESKEQTLTEEEAMISATYQALKQAEMINTEKEE